MPRKGQAKGKKVKESANVAEKKETSLKEGKAQKPSEESDNKAVVESKITSYFPTSPEAKKGKILSEEKSHSSETVAQVDTDDKSVPEEQAENITKESESDFSNVDGGKQSLATTVTIHGGDETAKNVPEKLSEPTKESGGAVTSEDTESTIEKRNESQPMKKTEEKIQENTKQPNSPKVSRSSTQKTSTKGKRKKEKNNVDNKSHQTEVSDFFSVRRSDRKSKSAIEDEKRRKLEEALLSGKEEDLEVQEVEGKGRGIFARRHFSRGDFVCEYAGELIDHNTAKEREKFYEGKTEFGCYMYYFSFKNKKFCVDATKESGRLGRLLNHSRTEANCATRLASIKDRPYLILETTRDVKEGEELLYDYGERSKDIVQSHPWLKS